MTGFPVTNTLMGLGSFPGTDPQFTGMLGMHGTYESNMAMQNCDVLFAIGTVGVLVGHRLPERTRLFRLFTTHQDWTTAFLAGVDRTTPGTYNGGLENYPRFHEDWGGLTLAYRGSFVSLGTPRHNTGPWCGTGAGCNIYNPPARNWDYDTDFQSVANPRNSILRTAHFTVKNRFRWDR